MTGHLNIQDIVKFLRLSGTEFYEYCQGLPEEVLFAQPAGKWSAAQQVKHLIISANNTRLAYSLPKFIVRLVVGKPNRNSRNYDELVAKYTKKLQEGGRASARFVPKPVPASYGKEKLLQQFNTAMERLAVSIEKKWTDLLLDNYLAPHPLLGKITLRELGYFTIHHTHHHLKSIRALAGGNG
ncbi:MAG: DinB family protein [Chitinophagaceae bacterium]|nr:DinB family protein [Chitinophagaceae bacterium]